jgi:hypothetical protein
VRPTYQAKASLCRASFGPPEVGRTKILSGGRKSILSCSCVSSPSPLVFDVFADVLSQSHMSALSIENQLLASINLGGVSTPLLGRVST